MDSNTLKSINMATVREDFIQERDGSKAWILTLDPTEDSPSTTYSQAQSLFNSYVSNHLDSDIRSGSCVVGDDATEHEPAGHALWPLIFFIKIPDYVLLGLYIRRISLGGNP